MFKVIDLSDRLKKIYDLVSVFPVLDVGADHGYLSIMLEKKFQKVYASEKNEGPYKNLLKTIEDNHSKVIPLFMDGIDKLPNDVKTLIIVGMGGDTICDILKRGIDKLSQIEEIIIEPQISFSQPITFLLNNGYINIYGTIVFEKRYYPLLKFKKSDDIQKYREEDYYYGPYVISNRDEMFIKMLSSQLKYYEKNNLLPYKKEEVKKIKKLLSLVK